MLTGLAGCSDSKPLPKQALCHLGGYRLSDGRVLGIIPRSIGDLRYIFVSGETGTLDHQPDGSWVTPEGSFQALTVNLGDCTSPSLTITADDGETLTGAKLDYQHTETTFEGIDGKRTGRLILPEDGTAAALVVAVQGSEKWSGRTGGRLQTLLPAYGIGVFAYDKRGTGTSDGEYTQDIDILSEDAYRALKKARAIYGSQTVRAGYLGGSQGAWVAPLAALKGDADFVIAAYGMAQGPLAEDREEVFRNLRDAGHGEDVIAKARNITDATAKVMASNFADGFEDLAAAEQKYGDEPWFEDIEGEFTGQFLQTPGWLLGLVGPRFDVGTSWDYEPLPTLQALDVPMLWVLAGEDREAPSGPTLELLRTLQTDKPQLDVVVFPDTDHGILEFTEDADGTRTSTRTAPGYYPLLRDWILTGRPMVSDGDAVVYPGSTD